MKHYIDSMRYLLILSFLFVLPSAGQSEITLDGSFGTGGSITGPNYLINSDMGKLMDRNLFHSFDRFNIDRTESATFTGPDTVQNIISRVTGGSQSNIDGLLRSTIPGADLFFINPAGVVFGPNATLDVTGSFHVSTADYITLSDGGRFDASNPGSSVLTVAPPSAFGFLYNSPKDITLNGSFLQVNEGYTLSLIGGNLNIRDASVYAPSGAINLIAVASSGEVSFSDAGLNVDTFAQLGEIDILNSSSDRSAVDIFTIGNVDVSGTGGGSIFIRGGQFVIDNGWIFADTWGDRNAEGIDIKISGGIVATNNSRITSKTVGGGNAGYLTVDAENLMLDSFSYISAMTDGSGNAGDVVINAGSLDLQNGSQINSFSRGAGNGGAVIVNATDSVFISGYYIDDFGDKYLSGLFCTSEGDPGGNGGYISVTTPSINMDNSALITTTSLGSGNSGNIEINVGSLSLQNGAQILSDSRGTGDGGTIVVNATDSVSISGYSEDESGTQYLSGFFCSTNFMGESGYIQIKTTSLNMDGGIISTSAYGDGNAGYAVLEVGDLNLTNYALIKSDTHGAGSGGGIEITSSNSISIQDSYITTEGHYTGESGFIMIKSPSLNITGTGTISTSAFGDGNAGYLSLNVDDLLLKDFAIIKSDIHGKGSGGAIVITAANSVSLKDYSYISTEGLFGSSGEAGYIFVEAPLLNIDSGHITSSAWGDGNAGYIELKVGDLELTNWGSIESNTWGAGYGGEININASNSISVLDNSYIASKGQWGSTGEAGFIFINAPSVFMDKGSISSDAYGEGNAGYIAMHVGDLILTNASEIKSDVWGAGLGGGININASGSVMVSDSSITTEGQYGSTGFAGYIQIDAGTFTMDNGKIASTAQGEGDAGNIELNAGDLEIKNLSVIESDTLGSGNGGFIGITASNSVTVSDNSSISTESYSSGLAGSVWIEAPYIQGDGFSVISANAHSSGNAGEVVVKADKLILKGGSQINSFSNGSGQGGGVRITATDSVTISGYFEDGEGTKYHSGLFCTANADGDGGFISITAPSLNLDNFAVVAANTGYGSGNAGNILIEVDSLSVKDGSQINSFSRGTGHGGSVIIDAANSVLISGYFKTDTGEVFNSGIFCTSEAEGNGGYIAVSTPVMTMDNSALIAANTYGSGNAGDVEINVGRLNLFNGAQINSASIGSGHAGTVSIGASDSILISGFIESNGVIYRSGLYCSAEAEGDAGYIFVTTPLMIMDGGRISVRTLGEGLGGDIEIQTGSLYLRNDAVITSSSSGSGDAGSITIMSALLRSENSSIMTSAEEALGGNISITSKDVQLTGNSAVTASVASGEGSGGNVDITTTTLVALEDSDITARADQGYGGNITINAHAVLFSDDIDLNASSNVAGREGTVEVNAPAIDISGNLADLPETFLRIEAVLPKRCAEKEEELSSFIVKGRDGLPPQPDSLLTSP